MPRHPRLRPSKAARFASMRIEALEVRQLLSSGLPVSAPSGSTAEVQGIATPDSISRVVAPPVTTSGSSTGSGSSRDDFSPDANASSPYDPAEIRHAYGVDQLSYTGAGQTIAIVDSYGDPTIQSDLTAFDQKFGLPAANLTVATPEGAPTSNPADWEVETALDVEWAHAIAPQATILLVVAVTDNDTDLLNGVSYAVGQGASQVSMSWGEDDFSGENMDDSTFDYPGVTFVASSGDGGAGVEYPAASPYVTAVGGTSLSLDSSYNRVSETAWGGSGGGYSANETKPAYQNGIVTASSRAVPDVSFVGDPYTGVYIDDDGSWYGVGGTSVGAPQWAGLIALANQGRAASSQKPVGTGLVLGTNQVLYGLAGGSSYTNAGGDFDDITSGSNGSGSNATTGWDPVTGLGSPVANNLIPALVGQSAPTGPSLGDAGFETVQVGSGNFSYDPTGSSWTFSGSAGLSANGSGFTSGNPSAPQGAQVALIQGGGSFNQSVANWTKSTYQISFDAAQRANAQASQEDFQVLVDGIPVASVTPTSSYYQIYTTTTFSVAAGTHTITFQGLDSAGGDNTAFIDNLSISMPNPNVPMVQDDSFEQVPVGAGNFTYDPISSPWMFSGGSGISGNNSGFTSGNPSAPDGSQVAFIQGMGSSFSQTITGWNAGPYQVSFQAAQRGNVANNKEDFEILVDGNVISTFTPTGTSYQSYTSASFTVTAGTHTITFQGLDSVGGDNTALIDNVGLAVFNPNLPTVGDYGFENDQVGSGNFLYDPTGSSWSFSGSAGLSANGSAFTATNPAAPQGTQVAFIQGAGSFNQSVANWVAGSYQISFLAAQRGGNQASQEDFQILVDGNVVSTFTPSGTSYQSYTSSVFTVTAGAHLITFKGLDSAGGDNSAFLDNVAVLSN